MGDELCPFLYLLVLICYTKHMNIAYKYRIYPNKKQEELINKTFGCCRKIWNLMLDERIRIYKETGKSKRVTPAMFKNEYEFLKEVDSLALANVQINLETAYKNFFRDKKIRFPKYKSKKKSKQRYTTNQVNGNIQLDFESKTIKLPKIGSIKIVYHRLPKQDWRIKSVTVIKNCCDQYFVSVLFEYEHSISRKLNESNALALDYKSSELYVDSNNHHAQMPHYFKLTEKKLARQQRKLSKKTGNKKGEIKSSNFYKQQKKVNKLLVKVANQRLDFLHKESRKIANSYDYVIVEDINMKSISQSLKMGKSTFDNGFGMFRDFLYYKLEAKGGKMIEVDKFFPSTKTCSRCGQYKKVALNERTYICDCGLVIDRDYNAALNLLKEGKRNIRAGTARSQA